MPIATLLPLIFSAVGAVSSGYTFLRNWERDHPGSKLTDEHMAQIAKIDPQTHEVIKKILAKPQIGTPDAESGGAPA